METDKDDAGLLGNSASGDAGNKSTANAISLLLQARGAVDYIGELWARDAEGHINKALTILRQKASLACTCGSDNPLSPHYDTGHSRTCPAG